MSVIVAENLTKHYGRRVGVEGVSLSVPAGTLFGFLGPNGAGKTTTIRLLLALLRRTDGSATVFGLDCWRHAHRIKADVGYVPGDLRLYDWMTARDAIGIFGEVRGRDLTGSGLKLAGRFNLETDVRVRAMSRGMRQKLGLILALAHDPKLLILDEPTSALDPLMQQVLYDELRTRATGGATVFFSSHTLSEVEELCDRVAVLREGKLVACESLDALRKRASRQVTVRFKDSEASRSAAVPAFLDVSERRDGLWLGTLGGPVMDLVKWAATMPLTDLAISEPNLETLFKQYYRQDGDGS